MLKNYIFVGLLAGCIILGVWLGFTGVITDDTATTPYPGLGGDFTLYSPQNQAVSLHDFTGQIVLIYFGYTHCPDVCIAALGKIARAIDSLPEKQRAQVQPIFISLDPERDSPEKLAAYGRNFHPQIISLSGSSDQVQAIAQRYFIASQKIPEGTEGAYRVDHSSAIYVLNRASEVLQLVHQSESAEDLAIVLLKALR